MKRTLILTAALAAAVLTFSATASDAEPTGALDHYDIGALMQRATDAWNLEDLDAVILLDRESVSLGVDGTRTTRVHRIVWMATEYALEVYGDLRVPWNSQTSELEVKSLRTWREGTWWPHESEISETAVVATIPGAVRSADDYTSIRETMLLHDGIELPCIVETVYEIREDARGVAGDDGGWTFARYDPCVVSRFDLSVPTAKEPTFEAVNGAPEPTSSRTSEHGVGYSWTMEMVDRLPRPLVADPASAAPHVVWSTWLGWRALGAAIVEGFDEAAQLSDALRESVAQLTAHEPFLWSKAEAVAGFVSETTRAVHYPERFWEFAPRPASTTWETAYGHRLDRAVLAAALSREAGCDVSLIYVASALNEPIPEDVPSLARFGGVSLWIEAPGLRALYDPESGTLSHGTGALEGRASWRPGGPDRNPGALRLSEVSELDVFVTLEPADDGWSGTGHVLGTLALSPYGGMVGLADESGLQLGSIAGSVLEGADVTDWSIVEFGEERVVCGFTFGLEPIEPDDFDRTRLEVGSPAGGIVSALPSDVHLYAGHRDSPVLLESPLAQTVTLRLDPGDLEIVHAPEPTSLANVVGSFELTIDEEDDGSLTLKRSLRLDRARVEAGQWPQLRALLLAETHERNGTFLLE